MPHFADRGPRVNADTPVRSPHPVKLTNTICPRCDGPLYYHPDTWLICRKCVRMLRIVVKGGVR
jgi:hypothetical protein